MTYRKVWPDANDKPGLEQWVQYGLQLPNEKIIWMATEDRRVSVPGIEAVIVATGEAPQNVYGKSYSAETDMDRINQDYRSSLLRQGLDVSEDVVIRRVKRTVALLTMNTEIL